MIAAGFGCRADCPPEDLLGALNAALAHADRAIADVEALCAPEFKAQEAALSQVAHRLGKPLLLIAREALQAQAGSTLTTSQRSLEHTGLPSVAETSALAGAAARSLQGAHLLGPRTIFGGATCALAARSSL